MDKRNLVFGGIAAIVMIISITMMAGSLQSDSYDFKLTSSDNPRATIIDQLHTEIPNEEFIEDATDLLENAGYDVDLFTTEDITVGFYTNLPSMNYDIIVIRSHALGDGAIQKSASLFTGEKYNDHKYIKEQFLGQVARGVPILFAEINESGGFQAHEDNTYFVIGSKLVNDAMVGQFNNSTIILGGCETMKKSTLANSFLKRGASQVIGWNGLVDSRDNDNVTLDVLKKTLENNVELDEAVISIKSQIEGKMVFENTTLSYLSHDMLDL